MLIQFFSTLEELKYVIALGTWSSTPPPPADSAGNTDLGCEEIALLKVILARGLLGLLLPEFG